MPLHWTISHPDRLVVATAKDDIGLKDIEAYLDGVVVGDALPYAKIFDLSQGVLKLRDGDMMALGARIRAYAATAAGMGVRWRSWRHRPRARNRPACSPCWPTPDDRFESSSTCQPPGSGSLL